MYSRILVPLDGSPLGEAILPHAIEFARKFGATVVLLRATMSRGQAVRETMAPEPIAAAPLSMDVANQLVDAQDEAAEQYLARIAADLGGQGIACETVVMEGNTVMALTDAVRDHKIELITMATHARSGLSRLFHGSVADSLVHDVHVPVLLIHVAEGGRQ